MYLRANSGYYLTENALVEAKDRHFHTSVYIGTAEDARKWRQVTEAEKAEMLRESIVLDVDALTPEYLQEVDALVAAIPAAINTRGFTDEEALGNKEWFPVWGGKDAPMGMEVPAGFRFRYKAEEAEEYALYKVLQAHALQADWVPGVDAASLYTVVSVHAGSKKDPIPYEQGMAIEKGKYYTQGGVLYVGILTTETGYPYDLEDMPAVVQEVKDEEGEA